MKRLRAFDVAPVLAIFLLLASLTFFWYLQAIAGASDEFSSLEAWVIPLYMATVLAGQFAALGIAAYLGRRFLGSRWPACVVAGALFALNFFANFLGHFGPFLVQDQWVQHAVLGGIFAFTCVMASEMHKSRGLRIGAVIVGALLLLGQIAVDASVGAVAAGAQRWGAQASLSPGMATDAATVRKVDFTRRPNVYLISSDTLTSDEVARRYIGIPTPLEYTKVLETNGARLLSNAFADREATRPSLNSMLALDVNYFDSLPDSVRFGFFAGRRRGPVAEIFRHNGYRIQTMYQDSYLGRWQGPYVDFYGVTKVTGVCDHIEIRLAFLGYCTQQMLAALWWLLPAIVRSESGPPYLDFVLERIRVAARDGRPWLTLAHLLYPGHVEASYQHQRASDRDEYREYFDRSQRQAASEIDAVMATIREVDPGAILLVFGDHGPLMTRNQHYDVDPEFYVVDRHAIRMAIWPAAACARELDDASRGGFITVAKAVRAIITCLSDGVDPVNKSVTYSLPYWTKDRYDRYLYDGPKSPAVMPSPPR